MDIGSQIKRARKQGGMTQAELAAKASISRSYLGDIEGNRYNPSIETLNAIADALNISILELLNGSLKKPPEARDTAYVVPYKDVINIPILGRVAAGQGCYVQSDCIEGYEPVPSSLLSPGESYIFLKVQGDSMSPKILNGDLVLIQCQTSVDSGDYAVVTIDDEDGVVKRVKYGPDWIELISENPYYPPRKFTGRDVLRIRVVGLVKKIVREL